MDAYTKDHQLWLRFIRGDNQAFADLYLKYHPLLLHYGLKICRDQNTSEDCIQDLFCYIYEKRSSLTLVGKVRPYLYLAYRRMLIQKIQSITRSSGLEFAGQSQPFQFSQEEIMIQGEESELRKKKLQHLLQGLTSVQREVIYLRYFAFMENKEIAKVLSIRHQSVLNILYRAFKKMRACINQPSQKL